jgi:ABC-type phosphate/phosphonate transport system substrate-binding protein
MNIMNHKCLLPLLLASAVLLGVAGLGISKSSDSKIRVLIIDGQNNHNWKDTTPFLKEQLEKSGKFEVSVATTPPRGEAMLRHGRVSSPILRPATSF